MKVLVITPTYNELESLPVTAKRLRESAPEVDLLIADDNSPDGTGQLADKLAADDDQIHVLHRPGKGGLGAAYIAGFRWGIERGYDVLVEMDADGSHRPEQLNLLLDAVKAGGDLVLGSRWVSGGSTVNWPLSRQILSRGGNFYIKLILGLPLGDATGGYRAYRKEVIQAIDLDTIQSQGYCFQVDLARRACDLGFDVREVPIQFVERELGDSKMSGDIVKEALWRVTVWGAKKRTDQLKSIVGR